MQVSAQANLFLLSQTAATRKSCPYKAPFGYLGVLNSFKSLFPRFEYFKAASKSQISQEINTGSEKILTEVFNSLCDLNATGIIGLILFSILETSGRK